MINYKYVIFILLVFVLGLSLFLAGCSSWDPSVQTAAARAEVKKINEASERESKKHQKYVTVLEDEADIQKLLKESKVQLGSSMNITTANYKAADCLLKKLRNSLPADEPILVASFVNIDNLADSSTFGRVVAEHFASRFNQKGYSTIEMKLRSNVFIKQGSGEFMLSREMEKISNKHCARAVVVGSYAVASKRIYLTSRVVNVGDGRILSSYDYDIPISLDVFKMLLKGKDKGKPGWL